MPSFVLISVFAFGQMLKAASGGGCLHQGGPLLLPRLDIPAPHKEVSTLFSMTQPRDIISGTLQLPRFRLLRNRACQLFHFHRQLSHACQLTPSH